MTNDFWAGRPVLVTGAGGFIASHLIESLVQSGARVRAMVRYNSRSDPGMLAFLPIDVYAQLEIVAGSLLDRQAVTQAMTGIRTVFHLGALISVPYSYVHPAEVAETNIIGTLNILQAAGENGVERLVHTSSSEVYGTALRVPIDEDHPLQAQSPYAASKIGADKLAESFFRTYNLPVVTLRPFNTYGPRQSARAVIPTIAVQALTQPVIHLGNLEARRDLTYVSDTAAGFLRAAEAPGIEGETINLGTGSDVRIGELVDEIIRITGRTVEVQLDGTRLRPASSEVQRLLADNSKARRLLQWKPTVNLSTGLEHTVAWVARHLDFYSSTRYAI